MNLIIITPGHPGPDKKSLPPAMTAPYLAAIAGPFADEIAICDLAVSSYDRSSPAPDVALFTTTMAQFDQVHELASYLKERGTVIILGGPYATLAYDFDPRIKEMSDCVVLGEGEKALPEALRDLKRGALQPSYQMPVDSLAGIPFSRLDLLNAGKYFSSTVTIGTRGCTGQCEYCSIRHLYGKKYLKRPVEEIIEEIRFQTSRPGIGWLHRKLLMFWDDNPACDLDWFNDLLQKMIPLKKWWLSQMCLNIADHEETVKLMKASGCRGIFVGLESISERTLEGQNKGNVNRVKEYARQCKVLLRNGINIIGAFMFGFDEDTKDTLFMETLEWAKDLGLSLMQTHLVTPYPHSQYFKTLKREGRILTTEAKYYNGYTVVHRPSNIHPAELQKGFMEIRKRFYSMGSSARRMIRHRIVKWPEFIVWNAFFRTPNYQVIPGVNVPDWHNYLNSL